MSEIEITPRHETRAAPMKKTPLMADTVIKPTDAVYPIGFDENRKYIAEKRVYVEFWANRATLEDASKQAEKMLLHCLYKDILCRVSILESIACQYDDPKELLVELARLKEDLGL